MSKNLILFIAIILSCSCIFASGNYRNATLAQIASYRESYNPEYNEWVEIEVVGLDDLEDGTQILACHDEPDQYLLANKTKTKEYVSEVYTVKEHINRIEFAKANNDDKPIETEVQNLPCIDKGDICYIKEIITPDAKGEIPCLMIMNIKTGDSIQWQIKTNDQTYASIKEKGKLFTIHDKTYYYDSESQSPIFYNFKFYGSPRWVEPIKYTVAGDTTELSKNIIVMNDKFYFLGSTGLYSAEISGTTVNTKRIDAVTVSDAESHILTDGHSRIWLINKTDGVIEYNIHKNVAETLAEFPKTTTRTNEEAFFFKAEFLYYIDNTQKAYAVNTHKHHKKEPRRPWGAPRIPFIEGGYEFKGLAEFFAMLHEYYLSIMCNGMPMMFLFDPRMCAFHLAPKAPAFDPARFNDAFMDDKYFYVYNPENNTITCTDVATGMEKEIGCYDDMPEDIIQIVFANNCFFILTKSGENHIARLAGPKLKYVTSWKLDDWTPRTGATVVAVGHAIYVFGGKELSDSKEESSSKCYSDLYVYDFRTGSSEKLEADAEVTARYNAKMLINRHFGRIWILGGKDESDATAADIWEFNTRNKVWTYINDLPTEDGNASGCYDEDTDTMSVLVTPEAETDEVNVFSSRSTTRGITRASSGVAVYELKDLAGANDLPDQSGKSCCGCLGLEFLLAIAGLFFFRRYRK